MTEPEAAKGPKLRVPWLATAGSLVAAVCWTVLVWGGGYCCGMLAIFSAGGQFNSETAQEYQDVGAAILNGAAALALAPWVIMCIVLPTLWGVLIWRAHRQRAGSTHERR
jgi:hypothetical protein